MVLPFIPKLSDLAHKSFAIVIIKFFFRRGWTKFRVLSVSSVHHMKKFISRTRITLTVAVLRQQFYLGFL